MAVTSPTVLVGNVLTKADSDFESGSPTWVATSGANTPSASTTYAFSGTHSLSWTANSTSDSFINTGYYPAIPNDGYTFSGFILTPSNTHDTYIGVSWYTSGHSLIGSTVWGNDNPSVAGVWQPIVLAATSPSNAAYFQINVWVGTGVVNTEPFAIDLMYAADVPAQVLIDWYNPAFEAGSAAGQDFVDVTPWVRFDQTITFSSGRQDAISEIQSGSANFYLQNDNGWFTPDLSTSPFYNNISLGARTQINACDQNGVWYTRFDGAVSQITYAVDTTGLTNLATVSCSDVLAYMNRQNPMTCWTQEVVMNNGPLYTWVLNDSGNDGTALETSGNNGPVLRLVDYATGAQSPTVTWQSTNGGVETQADAVGVGTADGSTGWVAGSDVAVNPTRGLLSGVVGPYTSPLESIYFKPALTSQSSQSNFYGTDGYQLNGELFQGSNPAPIATNSASNTYTIEAWYACDPGIKSNVSGHLGPFTVFSLGSGRRSTCLVAGLYYSGSNLEIQLATYAEPPSYPFTSFGTSPTIVASASAPVTADTVPIPHHLVVEIQGASGGGTATMYLDNVLIGTVALAAGQIYDTIAVGGAYGGHGNFYGNISCVSIYNYLLSANQIAVDCAVGQYGFWEQTTDNCIAAIGQLSDLPSFWNNLSAQNNGLSLTDYQNISGATPLANMQIYEQTERGLLFVNSQGQLSFHTRDWRMGYGAPDLSLPLDSYNANLGYELIDTFLLNESSVGTTVFTSGIAAVNQLSSNTYGTYASGTAQSPTQLPLITWNRSFEVLGLVNYGFYQDPNLTDNANWAVNTRSIPRLTCGSLTINMETLSSTTGLNISNFYGVGIDNVVTLTGMPASFPDQSGALDYFIEGVNETIGIGVRDITFYTSPAQIQRAWKPGDATYGKLGTTSRIGISMPDISTPPALGKDVGHDAGGPYWPPSFQTVPGGTQIGYTNSTTTNPVITPTTASMQNDYLLVQIIAPVSATITVSDSVNGSYTQIASVTLSSGVKQYLFGFAEALPLNPSSATVTITTSASQEYTTSLYRIWGVTAVDAAAVTAIGTSTAPSVTGGTMAASNDFELVVITNNNTEQTAIPTGWTQLWWNYQTTYQNQLFWRQATSTSADAFTGTLGTSTPWGAIAISFTVAPYFMNNPAGNGHNFIGALEMRGIRDTLALGLNPPLCVVGQVNDNQTLTTGNNQIQGRIIWDTVYVDTVGGMGIVPGWPNWYCCLVPGYYEIDASLSWQTQSSAAAGVRTGWIIVAQGAAALVALGTGTPYTGTTYVCPIGEEAAPNNNSRNPVNCASTRIYLGVGDMVGVGAMHTQGSSIATGTGVGGSQMSIRWVGYNTVTDQSPICAVPGSSGVVVPSTAKSTYTKTYAATGTFSYYGTATTHSPQLRATNGDIYQGEGPSGSASGSGFAFATFNHTQIASDTSGATITNVQLHMGNQYTWYNSGGLLMVGYTTASGFGSTFAPGSGTHFDQYEIFFQKGQTLQAAIPTEIGVAFQSGGATSLAFGNNGTTNLKYYGYWTGNTSPKLVITYVK